jgi:hypothetical protein
MVSVIIKVMTADEKRVVATSFSTTLIGLTVVFAVLNTSLDKLLPLEFTLLTASKNLVIISLPDILLFFIVSFGCYHYFKSKGIKPLYFKGPSYKYDRDNTYKISKRFQILRILTLFLISFLLIAVIFYGSCLQGSNIYC